MPETDRPARSAAALSEQFPSLEQGLYLNHAAIAPWPRCAAEALQRFAEENLRQGAAAYAAWIRRENALRQALARLVGAHSDDTIALLKNTTEGISTVAWGLDWRAGDNIVLPLGEFASNRLPWLAQAAKGVEIREVDIRSTRDAEAALIDAMDSRTRLLSVSAVQWCDGFRLDLGRLGDGCHRRRVLFFVDAIQQLGALPVDVESCRIDFLAADAHKWLLGPEGIAVFYSADDARNQLALQQQGWHMFDDPWNFQRRDWTPADSARRFEAGSPNSAGQAALHASVGLLLDHGMDSVARRVLENSEFLIGRLGEMPGLRVVSRLEPERRSGIVSFCSDAMPAGEIHRRLRERGCTCAVRESSVRISPHFYQDESVLDAFVEHLGDIL
ncbi:MAG TPA: aminotransferase class V-fold PLP-dependent enzyme [Xanthomonadales bacterium]|nr:aminotransferase class V-fold PLP-dependent enzyme [Xanthomonadales bacterium]